MTFYPRPGDVVYLTTNAFGKQLPEGSPMIVRRVDGEDREGYPVVADTHPTLFSETPGPLGFDRTYEHFGVPLSPDDYTTEAPK